MAPGRAPRFVADVNVGRLARRLRALGYDTVFDGGLDDADLVRIGLAENRVLLTRDSGLMERRIVASGTLHAILIDSDDVALQLKQVVTFLDLDRRPQTFSRCLAQAFSRCLECNIPLDSVEKEDVRDLVPSYVFETHRSFRKCLLCSKVYWQGSHWENMTVELERAGLTGLANP